MIIINENDALAALEILCPSGRDPVLSVEDMTSLLNGAKRAVIWTVSTSYSLGAIVMPTVRNGHRYRLIAFDSTGTTSAATEMDWPIITGSSATDGHLTWEEAGADYDSLWDIQNAAFNGWMLKASRAVCATDVTDGQGISGKWSQIYDHCVEMSRRYASVGVA